MTSAAAWMVGVPTRGERNVNDCITIEQIFAL
jgi:hypothetical protein